MSDQALCKRLAEFVGLKLECSVGKDYGGDFPPDAEEFYSLDGEYLCNVHDWHPDTDIAQAIMVFQKMRASHYWCCLSIESDFDYCWNICGVKYSHDDSEPHELYDLIGYSVEGDSPALAICLAADEWLTQVRVEQDPRFSDPPKGDE